MRRYRARPIRHSGCATVGKGDRCGPLRYYASRPPIQYGVYGLMPIQYGGSGPVPIQYGVYGLVPIQYGGSGPQPIQYGGLGTMPIQYGGPGTVPTGEGSTWHGAKFEEGSWPCAKSAILNWHGANNGGHIGYMPGSIYRQYPIWPYANMAIGQVQYYVLALCHIVFHIWVFLLT